MLNWIFNFSARLGSGPVPQAASLPSPNSGYSTGAWNKPVRTLEGVAPAQPMVAAGFSSPPWSAPIRKPDTLILRRSTPARVEAVFPRPTFAPGRSPSSRSLVVVEHA